MLRIVSNGLMIALLLCASRRLAFSQRGSQAPVTPVQVPQRPSQPPPSPPPSSGGTTSNPAPSTNTTTTTNSNNPPIFGRFPDTPTPDETKSEAERNHRRWLEIERASFLE